MILRSVKSVNLAVVRTDAWAGSAGRTGIDKRPVDGSVAAHMLGLAGDAVCSERNHGGPDRAVYAFSAEEAMWWSTELQRPITAGMLGENITTAGVDIEAALIGERWQIGSTELEVTAPRIPCRVFAGFWDVPDLISRFVARARPGCYLRVTREGVVAAGAKIVTVSRPSHHVTIDVAFRALTAEPELIPRLAGIGETLPADIRQRVANRTMVGRIAP